MSQVVPCAKRAVRAEKTRGGFTLIELLIVLAICGVLVALVLPALGRIQESSRSVKCMNNLRQLAAAVLSYANEHNGELPCNEPTIWYHTIWGYLYPDTPVPAATSAAGVFPEEWRGTALECPEMWRRDPTDKPLRSYGFNLRAGDIDTKTPDKIGSLLALSSIAMLGDTCASNDLGRTTIWNRHRLTSDDRYSGFCNVAFMDGHVEAVKLTERITGEDGSNNYFDRFWGVTKYRDRW